VEVHLHNAHVPHGSGRGVIKVHAFEAIRRRVDAEAEAGTPTILCGDFNAPWSEDAKGPLTKLRRKWPDEVSTRWIEAEAALLNNPRMRDIYRDVHVPGRPFPVSHFTGREGRLTRHRYDYIFASPELRTEGCDYMSDWLERDERNWRPSDHAPVVATLTASI
jgi:endonuclease/exonuclease/phosphatase family metal-dependent hydrolase